MSLVFLFILLLSTLSGCLQSSKNNNDGREDFTFTTLNGTEKNLSDYRGKVVLLDMWATWCFPCQLVMPELKKIYGNYSRDELEIISINIDLQESAQLIQSYRDWFNDTYGIELNWIFGRDDGSISEKYLKEGKIPSFAIFNQNGRLHFNEAGLVAYDEVPPLFPENTTLLAPILDELIKWTWR